MCAVQGTDAGTLYCPLAGPDSYCSTIDRIAEREPRGEGESLPRLSPAWYRIQYSGTIPPSTVVHFLLVQDPVQWYIAFLVQDPVQWYNSFWYRIQYRGTVPSGSGSSTVVQFLLVQDPVQWYISFLYRI